MKTVWVVVLVCLIAAGFCSFVLAESPEMSMPDSNMGQKPMMMDKPMMGRGMMAKCPMMMGKSMVATTDGGVVVLIGNKLQKYDKDLVLQKEVELKIDMAAMQKKMMEMMQDCPMTGDKGPSTAPVDSIASKSVTGSK